MSTRRSMSSTRIPVQAYPYVPSNGLIDDGLVAAYSASVAGFSYTIPTTTHESESSSFRRYERPPTYPTFADQLEGADPYRASSSSAHPSSYGYATDAFVSRSPSPSLVLEDWINPEYLEPEPVPSQESENIIDRFFAEYENQNGSIIPVAVEEKGAEQGAAPLTGDFQANIASPLPLPDETEACHDPASERPRTPRYAPGPAYRPGSYIGSIYGATGRAPTPRLPTTPIQSKFRPFFPSPIPSAVPGPSSTRRRSASFIPPIEHLAVPFTLVAPSTSTSRAEADAPLLDGAPELPRQRARAATVRRRNQSKLVSPPVPSSSSESATRDASPPHEEGPESLPSARDPAAPPAPTSCTCKWMSGSKRLAAYVHLQSHHNVRTDTIGWVAGLQTDLKFPCPYSRCSTRFKPDINSVKKHMVDHMSKKLAVERLRCEICNADFSGPTTLASHRRTAFKHLKLVAEIEGETHLLNEWRAEWQEKKKRKAEFPEYAVWRDLRARCQHDPWKQGQFRLWLADPDTKKNAATFDEWLHTHAPAIPSPKRKAGDDETWQANKRRR